MNPIDKEQIQSVDWIAKKIEKLYHLAIQEASLLGNDIDVSNLTTAFTFSKFPKTERKINEILNRLSLRMISLINQTTERDWLKSVDKNNALIDPFRKYLSKEQLKSYSSRNLEALKSFQTRKSNGLNLSEKVWKYTKQFKGELEMGLDLGIRDGRSSAQISRDLRSYLHEPNKLFRRVRDEHGNLHLSRNAKEYKPGQGVYRSSFKNSMRIARTEVNMAYRTSDLEKYNQFDFVVGYEVKRSNRNYGCPVCQSLAGKYPKSFKFVGWHPHCLCYTVPILISEKDFLIQQNAILDGKTYIPNKQITDVPDNFKQWVFDNKDRIKRAKKTPYFLKDNKKFLKNVA